MTGLDAGTAHPMHVEAALGAVQRPGLKLALDVGFHLEELEPEHLGVDSDRMIASSGSLRLGHELVSFRGLLGQGPDGVLEDLAFSAYRVREGQNVAPTTWKPVGPIAIPSPQMSG